MEMSHRSPLYMEMTAQIEANLRELMAIPDDYAVIFMQGGATLQFSALVWNLLGESGTADYAVTGLWSRKAQQIGSNYCKARVLCDAADFDHRKGHDASSWDINPDASFVHYCPNETVHGLEYADIPDTGAVPLVADFSSSILSAPLDVSRFGLIYGGAQKNIGPAGITLLICRRDLLQDCAPTVPAVLSYKAQEASDSMLNTPPTYSWYLVGLMLEWLKEQGGLAAMEAHNKRKAALLYERIDRSNFYNNLLDPAWRSRMNVVFNLADPELEAVFVAESDAAGLRALKGHKAVGGIRASLYNAVPLEAVEALVDFMGEFERRHG
eukprot:snap_masked-scaffold7974_size2918-processed-gene-0.1 protein:Tk02333 transcript:snap_masked-scaffold7974_size2918-processed-gene-0.1-mRNA-1 annotation:"mfs transporter"